MTVHKDYYAQAAFEVAEGRIDTALFVKALSMAGGDEKNARAVYIGLRAEEIQRGNRVESAGRVAGAAARLAVDTTVAAVAAGRHVAKSDVGRKLKAAFASFIVPGLGQLQEGERRLGLLFLVPWLASLSILVSSVVYWNVHKEEWASLAKERANAIFDQVRSSCAPGSCLEEVRRARSLERSNKISPAGVDMESVWGVSALLLLILHLAAPLEALVSSPAKRAPQKD